MTPASTLQAPRLLALSEEKFQDLKRLDTCSVARAIERFRPQSDSEGLAEGEMACRFPGMAPVLGYAVTLRVRSSLSSARGDSFLECDEWWHALQAVPGPRIVVLQDMDRSPGASALVGEMEACVLKSLDCAAVVTNGAVCDVGRLEGLDFQMFSGALSVTRAHGRVVSVGGPVQVGNLEISPGDLLHGDSNGIVRVPKELAARIPSTAAALRQQDQAVISYCHSADFSIEGLRDLLARR